MVYANVGQRPKFHYCEVAMTKAYLRPKKASVTANYRSSITHKPIGERMYLIRQYIKKSDMDNRPVMCDLP